MLTLGLSGSSSGLHSDGVALLPDLDGADPLSLLRSWLRALRALVVDRAPTAQVEVPSIEICLMRKPGLTLELAVVALEPEPHLASRRTTIDLVELRGAIEATTRHFLREAAGDAPSRVELEQALREATGRAIVPWAVGPTERWHFTQSKGELAITLEDVDARTLMVTRGSASLAALLTAGSLRVDGLTSDQPPFLALLGVLRRRPSREAYELGLSVCAALHERQAQWATNPWVDALFVRCTEGLASLRQPVADTAPAPTPPSRRSADSPLAPVGAPRRVTLRPRWSRPVALGEPRGRLELSRKFAVLHSPHAAHVFTVSGREVRRVQAPRGVAASSDGMVLVAGESRLACYAPDVESARWLRTSVGLRIGPELEVHEGVLRTRLSGRGVLALASQTGAELWRFDPPRSQRATFTAIGERLVLGTDSGELFGVDLVDGQVRFRIRGGVGVPWPVVPLQRDAIVVITTGGQTVLARFAALASSGAQAGAVGWTRPIPLETPSRPVVSRGRIFIGGRVEGRGAVACLTAKGEVLWLRSVPLEGGSLSLAAYERGVIVSDVRGAAVRLLPDGDTSWVVGGLAEALMNRLAPTIARGILVLPGVSVRLIEPRSGRVVSATPPEPDLVDVVVGRGLSLFTYAEPGTLTCHEVGAVFSVA